LIVVGPFIRGSIAEKILLSKPDKVYCIGHMARILSIYIDPDICTSSQACADECPEVLEMVEDSFVPLIREGAEKLFESHVEKIKAAADVCPVEAITLQIEED
jgi:ferredoxin